MKIYRAYYLKYLISTAEDKESIYQYMKKVRKLKKREYNIIEEDIPDKDIIKVSYEDTFIISYKGVYLTNIDKEIIEMEFSDYMSEVMSSIYNLNITLDYMKKTLSEEDILNIECTIETLKDILRDENISHTQYIKRHELNNMNIINYIITTKKIYRERKEDILNYIRHITEEDV